MRLCSEFTAKKRSFHSLDSKKSQESRGRRLTAHGTTHPILFSFLFCESWKKFMKSKRMWNTFPWKHKRTLPRLSRPRNNWRTHAWHLVSDVEHMYSMIWNEYIENKVREMNLFVPAWMFGRDTWLGNVRASWSQSCSNSTLFQFFVRVYPATGKIIRHNAIKSKFFF